MIKTIQGPVIHGNHVGTEIWFPTANVQLPEHILDIYWDGAYKINVLIKNDKRITGYDLYNWAWAFVTAKWVFEANIFDFSGDLYGQEIKVLLLEKMREREPFKDLAWLKERINKDVTAIKKDLHYVLTFWSFDELHKWHEFYLETAKTYWDRLVTVVANSTNIEKFKGHPPKYDNEERVQKMRELWISDIVHVWDTTNPLKWLELYHPKVICLWYDQVWFSEALKNHIKQRKLNVKVIRIDPYKEVKYKSSIIKEK